MKGKVDAGKDANYPAEMDLLKQTRNRKLKILEMPSEIYAFLINCASDNGTI